MKILLEEEGKGRGGGVGGGRGAFIRRGHLEEGGVHNLSFFRRRVYWREPFKEGMAFIGGFTVLVITSYFARCIFYDFAKLHALCAFTPDLP